MPLRLKNPRHSLCSACEICVQSITNTLIVFCRKLCFKDGFFNEAAEVDTYNAAKRDGFRLLFRYTGE